MLVGCGYCCPPLASQITIKRTFGHGNKSKTTMKERGSVSVRVAIVATMHWAQPCYNFLLWIWMWSKRWMNECKVRYGAVEEGPGRPKRRVFLDDKKVDKNLFGRFLCCAFAKWDHTSDEYLLKSFVKLCFSKCECLWWCVPWMDDRMLFSRWRAAFFFPPAATSHKK